MKPMLSAKMEDLDKVVHWPVLCSPKLDGIRCLIVGGIPVTRNLKNIPNRAIFDALKAAKLPPLDGELIVGSPTDKLCYNITNSGVMSRDGEPDWRFYVFDIVADGPFEQRIVQAEQAVRAAMRKCPRITFVEHTRLYLPTDVYKYEEACLNDGYEGIMGRSLGGTYKQGRSTIREGALWKLKRFEDSEAVVLGFDEQMHNANEATTNALGHKERSSHKANLKPMDMLGALKVRDSYSGVEFDIGTGFSNAEREEIWFNRKEWLGRIVKYKFLPVGVKEKPRHPVYLGPRNDL